MKKLFAAFAAAALLAPMGLQADDKASDKTIAEIVASDKNFSTLLTAVKAADLADKLNGEGPFTVFAPTNAAFEKLPAGALDKLVGDKEKLTKVLMLHVVKDKKVMAKDVVAMEGKELECGHTVKVEGGKVMLVRGGETIKVTKTDIKAKNGVIHVIDTVITPKKGGSDR